MMVHTPLETKVKSPSNNFGNLLLLSAVIILGVFDAALHHPSLWAFIIIALIWSAASHLKLFRNPRHKRLLLLALALVSLPLLLTTSIEPSYGALLSDAQTFFTENLATEGAASQAAAANMIFNVARGLYILYVVVAILNAWNSSRQDEDWVPVIKVPILSFLAISALDVITGLIIA